MLLGMLGADLMDSRRQVLRLGFVGLSAIITESTAQTIGGKLLSTSQKLGAEAALKDAARSGLLPGTPAKLSQTDAMLSLVEALDGALVRSAAGDREADDLAQRIGQSLAEMNRSLRDGKSDTGGVNYDPETKMIEDTARARRWTLDLLAGEYIRLFRTAEIRPERKDELNAVARRIISAGSRGRYAEVEKESGVPWYVIGSLHYREASLNFLGHLHNGDPLRYKTLNVPSGRPRDWPPSKWARETPPRTWNDRDAWRESALDALRQLPKDGRWTIPEMLFAFEVYNGMGYRDHPGFRSPYLWGYTKHYTKGGFPRDHVWSPTYVSKQAGLAAVIKTIAMHEPGLVALNA